MQMDILPLEVLEVVCALLSSDGVTQSSIDKDGCIMRLGYKLSFT